MYYRDPELFMRQAVVDRYVDDIAYTFGVCRDALNVVGRLHPDQVVWLMSLPQVAAAKGLVAGSFSVQRKDDSVIDCSIEPEVGTIFVKSLITGLLKIGHLDTQRQGNCKDSSF
jgi:meiotic recombination protein SPO11